MVLYYLLLLQTIISIAVQGTRPIVSLFADSQGVSVGVIGFLVSAYAFFPMLFAVKAGKWLDVYGARHMCLLGNVGLLVSVLIPIMFPILPTLFFSQLLMGFSQICCLIALQKTVGNLPGNRDNLIAIFSLTGSVGELIGPLASGYGYEYVGFRFTFAMAAVFVGLVLISILFVPDNFWKSAAASRREKTVNKAPSWKMLQHVNLRKALIISGLVLYSKDLFVAYFPVLGTGAGMNASSIGIILSLVAASSIGVRLIQFRLLQIFGRGQILTGTLVISGISFMLLNVSSLPVIFGLIAVLLGIGLGLGQPLSLAYAMKVTPLDKQGEVLGLRLTFNRSSQFVSPFFFGAVGRIAGLSGIFMVSGVVLLLGASFTRMQKGETEKLPDSMREFPLTSREEESLTKKTN